MKCINWNLEWAPPTSTRGRIIKRIVTDLNPDVCCFTEVYPELFQDTGHILSSQADDGYKNTGDKRKVIFWSSTAWEQVDNIGHSGLLC